MNMPKNPNSQPSPTNNEALTGVSAKQREYLQSLTVDPNLPVISTIEWGNRMHAINRQDLFDEYRAEYTEEIDSNGNRAKVFTGGGKDYQQSERIEKIRNGEANFEDIKQWYFQLGAEPDIFEPQGNKLEDIKSSNSMRMYLIKSALMVIEGIKDNNVEFRILQNKITDKRTFAANLLMEAAITGLNNGADPIETLTLLETSKSLLSKVILSQSPHKDEASMYFRDATYQQLFLLLEQDQSDAKTKSTVQNLQNQLENIGSPEMQIIQRLQANEANAEIIGESSEALASLILRSSIKKRAGDILLARKAFLREDMPFDGYVRNGERRIRNVAADLVVYIYTYDNEDNLILDNRIPLQVKFTGVNVQENEYDRRVKIVEIESIGNKTNTDVRRIGNIDNIFNTVTRVYKNELKKPTSEINRYEKALIETIEPKGGRITESLGL